MLVKKTASMLKKVWNEFEMKTGRLSNIYLKTLYFILLLADVFEEFNNVCLECYELGLCHYFSSLKLR